LHICLQTAEFKVLPKATFCGIFMSFLLLFYTLNNMSITEGLRIEFDRLRICSTMMPEDVSGIPARITAVHKERYELVCEYGYTFERLKTSIYYAGGFEDFPTAGDFVLIDYNPDGDSRIVKTLKRKSFFSRRNPRPGRENKQLPQTLTMCLSCNRLTMILTSGVWNAMLLWRGSPERYP